MAKENFFATHPTLRRVFIGACLLAGILAIVLMFGEDRAWSVVEAIAQLFGSDLGEPPVVTE